MDINASKIETGIDLFERLNNRSNVLNLLPQLFKDPQQFNSKMIQIQGTSEAGKKIFIFNIILQLILPVSYKNIALNGKNMTVLLINCNNNLGLIEFTKYMEQTIGKFITEVDEIKHFVELCLSKIIIINSFSPHHFKLVMNNLGNVVGKNINTVAVVIDSLSSFYWIEKEVGSTREYNQQKVEFIKQHVKGLDIIAFYKLDSVFYDTDLIYETDFSYTDVIINVSENTNDTYQLLLQSKHFRNEIIFNEQSLSDVIFAS